MTETKQALGPNERKEAASHILLIMGNGSPMVKRLAEEIIAEPDWTQESPLRQGEYWHWNGDIDCCPVPTFVLWCGSTDKCFVSMGQLGLTHPIDCDDYGGWWKQMITPIVPTEPR